MTHSRPISDVTELLAGGDLHTCRPLILASLKNEESLKTYFQSLLAYGSLHPVERSREENIQTHPVVILNSLKNLVSLRLENPSEPLVTLATEVSLSVTPDPPGETWRNVPAEKLNEPFFVMDLLLALEAGDRKTAFQEAARMFHLSDNEYYLVDILTEAAVREFPRLGLFGYAFHRAAAFCKGMDITPFSYRLLETVSRDTIGPLFPGVPPGFRVDFFAEPVLKSGDPEDVILLAVADRLWNVQSMKRDAYRKAVAGWFGEKWTDPVAGEKQERAPEGKDVDWTSLLKTGDARAVAAGLSRARETEDYHWPVDVAEYWLRHTVTENPRHFVLLDAVQHLAKVLPAEHMIPLAGYLLGPSRTSHPTERQGKSRREEK